MNRRRREVIWRDDRCDLPPLELASGRQNPAERRGRTDVVHPESLPAMPLAALHAAGDELIAGLRQMMPGVAIEQRLIGCTS